MAEAKLTVRGVKAMLTSAGVSYAHLDIHTGPVRTGKQAGKPTAECAVVIEGPKAARTAAFHVLLGCGLTVAPYLDHDEWMRR